ncbi:hypothetical protein [Halogranum rubrum]|uniref:Uncharacterized protein n=1 Tax=Halogranum salarium B-1 TaxID=1210908 RepID=J3EYV0_9EURY|nr:hypothetical protein [Halogranum salarium]EJN60622.1 hypothetical protein HSB1_12250 [Halogranum salarium B-1]
MVSLLPLQIPGGPELLIILLTLLFTAVLALALPAVIAYVVYRHLSRKNSYDERIHALETEVEELRRRVD